MSATIRFAFSVLFLASLAACIGIRSTTDTAAEERALRESEAQWVNDIASKDMDKVLAYYADDAIMMAPGVPAAAGKDAIRARFKTLLDDPNMKLTFTPQRVVVAKSGDVGYTVGSYEITMTDASTKKVMNDRGSYVAVYRKNSGGKWVAVSDINTSSLPPAVPGQ